MFEDRWCLWDPPPLPHPYPKGGSCSSLTSSLFYISRKTGSLGIAVQEFSLAKPSWYMKKYAIVSHPGRGKNNSGHFMLQKWTSVSDSQSGGPGFESRSDHYNQSINQSINLYLYTKSYHFYMVFLGIVLKTRLKYSKKLLTKTLRIQKLTLWIIRATMGHGVLEKSFPWNEVLKAFKLGSFLISEGILFHRTDPL